MNIGGVVPAGLSESGDSKHKKESIHLPTYLSAEKSKSEPCKTKIRSKQPLNKIPRANGWTNQKCHLAKRTPSLPPLLQEHRSKAYHLQATELNFQMAWRRELAYLAVSKVMAGISYSKFKGVMARDKGFSRRLQVWGVTGMYGLSLNQKWN
jgi:hypothetical protein